jgi:ribosomal protein S18 acetylase RimI-like enzyme
MNDGFYAQKNPAAPVPVIELVTQLDSGDLHDLCDATDAGIQAGGGYGWVTLPARDILERFWQGVMTMPQRRLFVARLDGVICGSAQIVMPPRNNEAQRFSVQLTTHFVAPWARGHGLARGLVEQAEKTALDEGFSVVNLDVRETQEAAISLYESLGYIHFGTHPFYARVDDKIISGRHYYKVINADLGRPS